MPSPFFVTYDHPSQRPALKQYLQDHGVAVHGYVPDNTWLVYGTEQDVAGAEEAGLAISVVRSGACKYSATPAHPHGEPRSYCNSGLALASALMRHTYGTNGRVSVRHVP